METDNAISRGSWLNALSTYNCTAEDVRHQAEILRQKGKAIRIEADALAKYYQLGVNNRFHDQIQCNREWLHLLQDMLNMITSVTQTLGEIKIEGEHFIATLNDAITVNAETIAYRNSQLGGDSFNDEVQTELYKESELQKKILNDFQLAIDDAVVLLQDLILIRREIEKVIADKNKALKIDIDMFNINEKSANVSFKPLHDRESVNYIDLQTWDDILRELLPPAEEYYKKSLEVCERLYDTLNNASNRLTAKADDVSQSLRRQIHQINLALRELHYQQIEATSIIFIQLEKTKEKLIADIAEWQSSKASKTAQHKLNETRTETRTERPALENTKDAVYFGLNDERSNLLECSNALDKIIVKAREQLKMVEDEMAEICEQIRILNHPLEVDNIVIGMRGRLKAPEPVNSPFCPQTAAVLPKKPNFD
ncbi:unnamed protein product [Hymenolepis diminuta]|uniref:Tektin n=2 Tax=Hymenolepis diminuta TaxID=6216 RepID=A0A158QFJ6_HYMDI|nr:unnamed protein product [Hymenolepis diminuta]